MLPIALLHEKLVQRHLHQSMQSSCQPMHQRTECRLSKTLQTGAVDTLSDGWQTTVKLLQADVRIPELCGSGELCQS